MKKEIVHVTSKTGGESEGAGTAGGISVEGEEATTTTTTPPETPANETTTTIQPTTTTSTIPESPEKVTATTPLGRFLTNPAPGIAGIVLIIILLFFGIIRLK